MSKNMVKFLMPDGTEVSNDPDFELAQALEKSIASTEYRGSVGPSWDEQNAQTQVMHEETLNSGQPGVGDNSVPEDIVKDAYGPLGSPAQQRQAEDAQRAEADGASPQNTSVDDPEPVDSNEAVLEVQRKVVERREAAMQALEDNDESPGDPEVPYTDWSGRQLKAEVAVRNADGRTEEEMIQLASGMKKSDVAELLDADDARKAGDAPADPGTNQE